MASSLAISGSALSEAILVLAASRPGGWISLSELVEELNKRFEVQGRDAQLDDGRTIPLPQLVQEMTSDAGRESIIRRGFAECIDDGVRITEFGREYLGEAS